MAEGPVWGELVCVAEISDLLGRYREFAGDPASPGEPPATSSRFWVLVGVFPRLENREMSANEDSPQNRKNRAVGLDAIEAHDLTWVHSPGLRLLCEIQRSDRFVRT